MKEPFFSILIATYNRPTYIGKCLESVLLSGFKDFEIIISDDHSQKIDEIKAEIQPYLKFPNVNFIYQPRNLGFHDNYNYLIDKAKGKFLILVDDDDKLKPDALRKLKEYIDKNVGYDLYGFGYEVIDEDDNFYCSYCPPRHFEISLAKPKFAEKLFLSDVLPFQVFHSCAVCFRRKIGREIRRRKEASIGADLLFLFQAVNQGKKMLVIPEILFSYRKMLGRDKKEYFNWTGPSITNIISRRNILYDIFYREGGLNPYVLKLISSIHYRKRYLFNPIIFNKLTDKETLNELNLKKEHLEELVNLYKPKIYLFHFFRIRLEQLFDHLELFGFGGLLCLFLTFKQRLFYRFKKKSIF